MMKAVKTSVFVFILIIFSINVYAWPIPDTGQTKCYSNTGEIPCPNPGENFYGQDGNYTIDPPSYTKLDANGTVLTDSAVSWAMVKDNVTGLIWEVKTVDDSIHNKDKQFDWFAIQNLFIFELNNSKFGGFSDWRLPSQRELVSLVDYGRSNPAYNVLYLPNFPSNIYESYPSTTAAASITGGFIPWAVGNFSGSTAHLITSSYYVLAVRGDDRKADSLTDNGNGTISDSITSLMWQKEPPLSPINWSDAISYCETLSLANFEDWKLPNIKELESIVDYEKYNPAIDAYLFSNTQYTSTNKYWSSTSNANGTDKAWGISFYVGKTNTSLKTNSLYARCVRVNYPPHIINTTASIGGSISPSTPTIDHGSSQTFNITPDAHYHVVDVAVDGVSVGPVTTYSLTNVTAAHTISATFAINTYAITSSTGANGSITPTATVNHGSNSTFTITPNVNYHVADVLVDGASVGAVTSYAFTNAAATHTINAVFAIDTYAITSSAGANGGITPTATVNYGGNATFTITPDAHYHVADVLVDGASVGAVTSFDFTNVSAARTINAIFAIDTYAITSSVGVNGSITPTATINYGGNATFTITPNAHYHVADVLVDGASVGAVTSYAFTNVTTVHTISATFAIDTHVFTVTKSGTGLGMVAASPGLLTWNLSTGTENYDYGTVISLTATPDVYSIFTGWSGGECSGTAVCTVTMNSAKSIGADFRAILKGDIDDNLTVDLADAILAMQIMSGVISPGEVYSQADVNEDQKIGLPEMIYILQKVTDKR